MSIKEFEERVRTICARNKWELELEFHGVWKVSVLEKSTGKVLAWTGMTSLAALPKLLEMPLEDWV